MIRSRWKRLSRSTLLDTPFLKVYLDAIQLPNGIKINDYSVATLPSGVVIVATDNQGRLLVQSEYKYAIDKFILNLPSGSIEDDDILTTARKELIEETGYDSSEMEIVRELYEYPSKLSHSLYIIRARNVRKIKTVSHEETEFIEDVRLLSVEDFKRSDESFNTTYTLSALALTLPEFCN